MRPDRKDGPGWQVVPNDPLRRVGYQFFERFCFVVERHHVRLQKVVAGWIDCAGKRIPNRLVGKDEEGSAGVDYRSGELDISRLSRRGLYGAHSGRDRYILRSIREGNENAPKRECGDGEKHHAPRSRLRQIGTYQKQYAQQKWHCEEEVVSGHARIAGGRKRKSGNKRYRYGNSHFLSLRCYEKDRCARQKRKRCRKVNEYAAEHGNMAFRIDFGRRESVGNTVCLACNAGSPRQSVRALARLIRLAQGQQPRVRSEYQRQLRIRARLGGILASTASRLRSPPQPAAWEA